MMGYVSQPSNCPGGPDRDDGDHAHLRHGRDRLLGTPLGRYLQPAPLLFTRDGHNVFLGDMYRGASAFLLCGGPSLKRHDLGKLEQRGIITCAVNNAAAVVRPKLWVSVDDPGNFCDAIWRDPGILKFVPLCHMEKTLTERKETGELAPSHELVGDMPAVFGYRRNEAFIADQWLYEDTFNWGNHSDRLDASGIKGSRSVMFIALRMLFYLGIRRLYLLGCDFRMQFGTQNYAFEQDRTRASVNGNNSTYAALNVRLGMLKPYFDKEGYEIFNCTPDSGLKVFPHMEYEEAVQRALEGFPKTISTAGMYDRKEPEKADPAQLAAVMVPPAINSDGYPADPVASLDLPLLTVVTAVDRSNLEIFRWTWPTWMYHRSWLRQVPVIVISDPADGLELELKQIVEGHRDLRLIGALRSLSGGGRDQWSHAYLKVPATHVATDWYLRLEPEAVACFPDRWLYSDWFRPDSDGRLLAFVSHAWGYTKPADALSRLDDWGSSMQGLCDYPPLRLPYDPQAPKLKHDAISSWIFLGNTAWTREILRYAPEQLPLPSHDTFTLYCAKRRGDRFLRWQMKSAGWDHSFGDRQRTIRQCQSVLGSRQTVA